ncbi:probable receptor-like protein kinase At2g42960 [Raphanus sativus]|uniref:non-specific serine/threonine protein kinase n=1 Tax=Raphanus sativus TaxID=3726 RepID=A0A6J0LD13_RAPSA|nr:probable receptor-like protein kinase At2g42960 [Raphanus sativus]XP_056851437.1 probable receptor-like protein kinase At2g42960 [Raphanus sativus]XP_056851438.1 probable receptor-like protein kinase At2g42960 [Raphanus sativus]
MPMGTIFLSLILNRSTQRFLVQLGHHPLGMGFSSSIVTSRQSCSVTKIAWSLCLSFSALTNIQLCVLLLEAVTGRDPVDYGRPANEVNLVECLKMMVGTRRAEEVVDPRLEPRPSKRALNRALLVSLRCVDPEAEKRPRMSQVVRMLESEEPPFGQERRNRKSRTASIEIVETKDESLSPAGTKTRITEVLFVRIFFFVSDNNDVTIDQ